MPPIVPNSWGSGFREFNTNHVPAGSPRGGQFASVNTSGLDQAVTTRAPTPGTTRLSPDKFADGLQDPHLRDLVQRLQAGPSASVQSDESERLAQASISTGDSSAFEAKLRDAPVTSASDIDYDPGFNPSEWLRTTDGTPLFYKPSSGENFESYGTLVRDTINNRDFRLAEREVLAYRVDQALGTNLVPPTVLRNREGGSPDPVTQGRKWGSAQLGQDGTAFADSGYSPKPADLWKSVILDIVIGNADRHGKNAMVGDPDENNEVPIIAIDHGYSFPGGSAYGNTEPEGLEGMALGNFRHELVDRYFIANNPRPPAALTRTLLRNLKTKDWAGLTKPFKMNATERESFLLRVNRVTEALETDTMADLVKEAMRWGD